MGDGVLGGSDDEWDTGGKQHGRGTRMSWLVRIQLGRTALLKCRFRDAYAWHQAAWKCFPGMPLAERDFLTRCDWMPQGMRMYLLCRSEPVRPAWCPEHSWAVKVIAPSFLEHDVYAFDLVANATRKDRRDNNGQETRSSRRLALVTREERIAWLQRKSNMHGFILDGPLSVEDAGTSVFSRNGRTVTHVGVHFRGCLRVSERRDFIHAFYNGLGSAKSFGYGMLLLQPLG